MALCSLHVRCLQPPARWRWQLQSLSAHTTRVLRLFRATHWSCLHPCFSFPALISAGTDFGGLTLDPWLCSEAGDLVGESHPCAKAQDTMSLLPAQRPAPMATSSTRTCSCSYKPTASSVPGGFPNSRTPHTLRITSIHPGAAKANKTCEELKPSRSRCCLFVCLQTPRSDVALLASPSPQHC